MPFTLDSLTSAIESYLQNTETTFVSYIPTIILQVEDRISKAMILPANRQVSSPTVTSGNSSITLPADFLAPFSLQMILAGIYTNVSLVDASFMREAYPDPTTTGTPRYYAMASATTFSVAPTPTTGLTSSLNYFYKPASLTVGGGSGTTWLSSNAENCLLYGCLSEAYTYLKGEMDLMKLYEEKFQAALGDLRTLGEGMDMGDSFKMGEARVPRGPGARTGGER